MNTIAKAENFVFADYEAHWADGNLYFHYDVVKADETVRFTETWHIQEPVLTDNIPSEIIENLLRTLHLLIGISYYKMYCPKEIKMYGYELTEKQSHFWNTLYTKGLGEFFYQNKLDYRDYIVFPFKRTHGGTALPLPDLEDKALVMHGGGKDSIVSAESITRLGIPFDLFCLHPQQIHTRVAEVMSVPIIGIQRTLDEKVNELNASGEVYNGHVPVTAMYSCAAVLIATLRNYKYIVASNERSSDYGNVEYLGSTINHQWSKSQEAEDMMREYIHTFISPDLSYFSLLRPFYEIEVVKKFSHYPQYFEVFSSSNHNFRIDSRGKEMRWDYTSPKTVFVYTLLAAYVSKTELIRIFGENLFERTDLMSQFQDLLGLREIKPFECVGTPEEMIVALSIVQKSKHYDGTPVIKMFEDEILGKNIALDDMEKQVFSYGNSENIPQIFRSLI